MFDFVHTIRPLALGMMLRFATNDAEIHDQSQKATHWDEVVTRLGFEHLRRHDHRHTGLTWFADAGVPLHRLQ
ncbi:hypothetical protein [Nocardia sp. NPDC058497]|uniref:hypothetical protein n=1 Tax=Nocardia sp. NPDC058497 TaxID=3346529 RepID=UPI00365E17FB